MRAGVHYGGPVRTSSFMIRVTLACALMTVCALGCGASDVNDASVSPDAGADGGGSDGGLPSDAGDLDGGALDGGSDSGVSDGGVSDGGGSDGGVSDGGASDAGGMDAGTDAGPPDAGHDAGPPRVDAGPPLGGCISGAAGTHVVRFQWAGTTSGSTAYVRYEANTLPDTSRWRVSAASSSIGYRPVFGDPFLGEGGLELSGTVFIDVELSTDMLSRVSNATIAIYGRSYNTTSSGSFTWQTVSGTGASPRGGVSNVAPYRWYGADATAALPAGDSGTLLRIRAGGPSNALVVNRVEICFDAR